MSKDPLVTVTLAVLMSAGAAHAEDAGAAPPAPPAETPAAAAPEGAAGAEAAANPNADANATEAEKALEGDLNLFWGKRRQVSVVQRRLVEKDGRFELTAYGSTIPNDDFIVYFPVGLRAGYHFSESFAVELSGAYAVQKPSDLTNFLESDEGLDLKQAQIQEKIKGYGSLDVLWAPIYGKISFLGTKLTHFETYVGLGGSLFFTDTTTPTDPNASPKRKAGGNALLGFRWFINDHFNIRTDYRHYFFQKFGGGVSIPAEFSLGLGFLI